MTTTATSQIRPADQVRGVDFAVPVGATVGPRFATWQEAIDHARATITRIEYTGHYVNEDAPDFHPLRHVQEGDTLVVYSRAFVHMRAVTVPHQPGAAIARSDGVVFAWEVFRDGTVEACPQRRKHDPEVPGRELLRLLARIFDDQAEAAGLPPGDHHGRRGMAAASTARAIGAALAEAGWCVVSQPGRDG